MRRASSLLCVLGYSIRGDMGSVKSNPGSKSWEPAVLSGPCLFALVTLEMTAVKLRQRDFPGLYRVVA